MVYFLAWKHCISGIWEELDNINIFLKFKTEIFVVNLADKWHLFNY